MRKILAALWKEIQLWAKGDPVVPRVSLDDVVVTTLGVYRVKSLAQDFAILEPSYGNPVKALLKVPLAKLELNTAWFVSGSVVENGLIMDLSKLHG